MMHRFIYRRTFSHGRLSEITGKAGQARWEQRVTAVRKEYHYSAYRGTSSSSRSPATARIPTAEHRIQAGEEGYRRRQEEKSSLIVDGVA
jgi:hypothetical protein